MQARPLTLEIMSSAPGSLLRLRYPLPSLSVPLFPAASLSVPSCLYALAGLPEACSLIYYATILPVFQHVLDLPITQDQSVLRPHCCMVVSASTHLLPEFNFSRHLALSSCKELSNVFEL